MARQSRVTIAIRWVFGGGSGLFAHLQLGHTETFTHGKLRPDGAAGPLRRYFHSGTAGRRRAINRYSRCRAEKIAPHDRSYLVEDMIFELRHYLAPLE
jgi:hypothetical protein